MTRWRAVWRLIRLTPQGLRIVWRAGWQLYLFSWHRRRAQKAFVGGAGEAGLPPELARDLAGDYPLLDWKLFIRGHRPPKKRGGA